MASGNGPAAPVDPETAALSPPAAAGEATPRRVPAARGDTREARRPVSARGDSFGSADGHLPGAVSEGVASPLPQALAVTHKPASENDESGAIRANRAAAIASCLALLAAIASAVFTYMQASEARRANDMLGAEQARNVYVDAPESEAGGHLRFSIRNDNKQPISNLYYYYQANGFANPAAVVIGVLPRCSRIALTPGNRDNDKAGFAPTAIFYTDPMGKNWRRERGQQPTLADEPPRSVQSAMQSTGTVSEVQDC
jgi:hypothetical protein